MSSLDFTGDERKMSCKYNNCKHCGYKSECEIFKENAELKKENTTYKNGYAYEKMYELRIQAEEKLTKAKEHIQTLISCLIDWVQEGDKDYCHIEEAEQFLKGE